MNMYVEFCVEQLHCEKAVHEGEFKLIQKHTIGQNLSQIHVVVYSASMDLYFLSGLSKTKCTLQMQYI